MRTSVKIIGDDKLRLKFRQMQADAAGTVLAVALRAGAEVIRTDAARRAPVRTGNLRRSIHTEIIG